MEQNEDKIFPVPHKKHKSKPLKPLPPHAPYPWVMQRYPHTYFNDRDGFPKFMDYTAFMMGILRDWDMSLTKLLALLDKQETQDADKLTEEITRLIDRIQSFNDLLATKFAELFAAEDAYLTANNNAHRGTINLFIQSSIRLTQVLNDDLYDVLNCIEYHLMEHDQYIATIFSRLSDIDKMLAWLYYRIFEIEQEIPDPYDDSWIRAALIAIYEILERLLSTDVEEYTLTNGVDYTISYHNGFCAGKNYTGTGSSIDGEPVVTRQRTLYTDLNGITTYTDDIIIRSRSNNCFANNDILYGTDTDTSKQKFRFKHSSSIDEEPRCKIMTVKFLKNDTGNDETCSFKYTDSEYVQTVQEGNQVWNMHPVRARASWPVVEYFEFSDNSLVIAANSIYDGFNQQYYDYFKDTWEATDVAIKNGSLDFALLNMTARAKFIHKN